MELCRAFYYLILIDENPIMEKRCGSGFPLNEHWNQAGELELHSTHVQSRICASGTRVMMGTRGFVSMLFCCLPGRGHVVWEEYAYGVSWKTPGTVIIPIGVLPLPPTTARTE